MLFYDYVVSIFCRANKLIYLLNVSALKVWTNYDAARWCGVRDSAHEKLYPFLADPVPEVSACFIQSVFYSKWCQYMLYLVMFYWEWCYYVLYLVVFYSELCYYMFYLVVFYSQLFWSRFFHWFLFLEWSCSLGHTALTTWHSRDEHDNLHCHTAQTIRLSRDDRDNVHCHTAMTILFALYLCYLNFRLVHANYATILGVVDSLE